MTCQAKLRGKIPPENLVSYQYPALPDPLNKASSPRRTPRWCPPFPAPPICPASCWTTALSMTSAATGHLLQVPFQDLPQNSSNNIKRGKRSHNMMHFCIYKAVRVLQSPPQTVCLIAFLSNAHFHKRTYLHLTWTSVHLRKTVLTLLICCCLGEMQVNKTDLRKWVAIK